MPTYISPLLKSLLFIALSLMSVTLRAAAPACGQAQVEKLWFAPPPPAPPAGMVFIYPGKGVPNSATFSPNAVKPFYQWEANNGYCGEVSLQMAGMSNGQWMSQYNSRLVCGAFWGAETNGSGASLQQAGSPLTGKVNYNSQVLIEDPNTGVSGPYDFAHAALCAANARLSAKTYPYNSGKNVGVAGVQDYLVWVKAEVMAGHQVMISTLFHSGKDPQYDHEVSVMGIGTTHSLTDTTTFYPDDILYFDDHGVYTLTLQKSGKFAFAANPSIPLGAGADATGCTPYVFSYTFGSLARTRTAANNNGSGAYSIVIPGTGSVWTGSGNTTPNGTGTVTIPEAHNYAISIAGPLDAAKETLPVTLTITGTTTNGVPNPVDPIAGYNYETPYIGGPVGTCDAKKQCVSNTQPSSMQMTFDVTVSGLTPGTAYNLYEYDSPSLTGLDTGSGAALNVPVSNFNSSSPTFSTPFVGPAGSSTKTFHSAKFSDQIVVFRAVPASAP